MADVRRCLAGWKHAGAGDIRADKCWTRRLTRRESDVLGTAPYGGHVHTLPVPKWPRLVFPTRRAPASFMTVASASAGPSGKGGYTDVVGGAGGIVDAVLVRKSDAR